MTIIALPGFLGVSEDWITIIPDAIVPDLPVCAFDEWADKLNAFAKTMPAPRTLAGYSLGGRLALHALIRDPTIWSQAVIISAHTGLNEETSKKQRRQEDADWAERFRVEEWGTLMSAWNQRGALKSSPPLNRKEADYNRRDLAGALDIWSLGRQHDLKSEIEALNLPILWIVGEKDFSFCEIACAIKFRHPKSRSLVVPNTGHRILHDNRDTILKEWP